MGVECTTCAVRYGVNPITGLCTPCEEQRDRLDQRPQCDACGHWFSGGQKWRSDDDGFTGCLPCFPLSNKPEDANRFMVGPCFSPPTKGTADE